MKEQLSFAANKLSVEEIEKNHHILDRNRKAYIFNIGSGDLIDSVCLCWSHVAHQDPIL